MAFAGMTPEQILVTLQNDNAQMRAEMLQMKQLVDQANLAAAAGAGQGGKGGTDWDTGKGFGKGGYQS